MKQKKHRSLWLWFDRVLSHDLLMQVLILVGLLAVVYIGSFVILSLSGDDWITFCNKNDISPLVFPLYLLIDSNAFNQFYMSDDTTATSTTIFWSCFIYVVGVIIFTGMIISVMTNMISRHVDEHKAGNLHYLKSGHYVIMGYDEMVPSIITHIFERDPKAYILLLSSAGTEPIREKLSKNSAKRA